VSSDFFKAKVTVNEVSGAVKITRVGKKIRTHGVDKLIVAIGQEMRSCSLPSRIQTGRGLIGANQFTRTALPNIFAGGDVTGGTAFVADAIASGKLGALAISCYLEGKDLEKEFVAHRIGQSDAFCFERLITGSVRESSDISRVVSYDRINTLFFDERPRNNPGRREVEGRKKTFDEVNKGLEPAHMEAEIARCFQCGTCVDCENCLDFCPDLSIIRDAKQGTYRFDSDYCKGCGVCSEACPRGVVEMVGEAP
jgi:Pyruvate/2-oxoacid:ferredoxin oxidoreductase delta subunit